MHKQATGRNRQLGAAVTTELICLMPIVLLVLSIGLASGVLSMARYHAGNAAMMGARAGALEMNRTGATGAASSQAQSTAKQFMSVATGCDGVSVKATASGDAVEVTVQCNLSDAISKVLTKSVTARAAAPYILPLRPR